ncbi:hypothetical protein EJ04DRAFT_426512 [Polyplosphaeria fusca]|uniref:Uncharacterized protein n=1 Tax=Polyplosphaeria fusca TaxID=682080 RepID=A0A9P4V4M2_9PLEO|nr:hypothetical protein EJ04DRAFT_426512 [Polyplosphaeria fusca]
MGSQSDVQDIFWDTDAREDASSTTSLTETASHDEPAKHDATLSLLESVITTYPPVLESLLAQIPTAAVLDLYHTSRYLRDFLQKYPLAWKTLSFRLPQPAAVVGSPGNETPDGRERQSKTYSFDALLKQVILPHGTRLTSLDLCNTAVSGIALVGSVLAPRLDTLQHLSVRGCKNVSIKYHIVPFLEPYTLKDSPWNRKDLALKSLYTYRCRHHRRRPYLPSSLVRRDSDSDPTHQLIEICHQLGIWTDTAWCPTPGGRCYRRKDYHAGRAGPQNMEVWVPYDRLWRSSNRLGSAENDTKLGATDGRLWEIAEIGQDGEPLGTENGAEPGEGKHVPAHLRKSHTLFIEEVKCAQCGDNILERCESCSVRMHCMGCRKTLCASCAFNRPIPRKRVKTRHFASLAFGLGSTLGSTLSQASGSSSSSLHDQHRTENARRTNRFWWAPGASRSPNLMNESAHDDDSSDSEDGGNLNNGLPLPPANRDPPKLNMHWCCLEPIFSGGGGIAVLGTGLGGRGADKIRAAPLPQTKQFKDPDFSNHLRVEYVREMKHDKLHAYVLNDNVDVLPFLKQESLDLQAETCPRGLCQDCYRSFRWKIPCKSCKSPLCKEHDFRGLKFRKCGYRDMHTEREYVRTHNEPPRLFIPDFNPNKANGKDTEKTPTAPSSLPQPSSSTDLESLDGTAMSQSQILLPLAASGAVDMSTSTSLQSHASNEPPASSRPPPLTPTTPTRPRSFSASEGRSRTPSSWQSNARMPNPTSTPLPLPCSLRHPVQWEGCGAIFCQYPRPVGDNRTQCPAIIKECTECAVLVCDACVTDHPICPCTFCSVNFHCPHCTRKDEVKAQCRLEEEIKAQEYAKAQADAKMEKDKEERGQANEMAEAVHEFWSFLLGDPGAPPAVAENVTGVPSDAPIEPPVPSPDSITVTTEFGVTQEPNHFGFIISTATPPSHDDEDEVEEGPAPPDHIHEDSHLSPVEVLANATTSPPFTEGTVELPGNTTAPPMAINITIQVQPGDMADDEGHDADLDENDELDSDDLDAESALIDEFIDDGTLTPATTEATHPET